VPVSVSEWVYFQRLQSRCDSVPDSFTTSVLGLSLIDWLATVGVTVAGDSFWSRLERHTERSALFVYTGKDREDAVRAHLHAADLPAVTADRQTTAARRRQSQSQSTRLNTHASLIRYSRHDCDAVLCTGPCQGRQPLSELFQPLPYDDANWQTSPNEFGSGVRH